MTQINLLSKHSSLLNARFCFQHTDIHEWAHKRYTDSSFLCWWSEADIHAILQSWRKCRLLLPWKALLAASWAQIMELFSFVSSSHGLICPFSPWIILAFTSFCYQEFHSLIASAGRTIFLVLNLIHAFFTTCHPALQEKSEQLICVLSMLYHSPLSYPPQLPFLQTEES